MFANIFKASFVICLSLLLLLYHSPSSLPSYRNILLLISSIIRPVPYSCSLLLFPFVPWSPSSLLPFLITSHYNL